MVPYPAWYHMVPTYLPMYIQARYKNCMYKKSVCTTKKHKSTYDVVCMVESVWCMVYYCKPTMTTMALSLSAIRLALSSRRQASAHSAVAAVSLSSSSSPSSAAVLLSRHGQSQTRSFHRHNNNINNNKDASSSSSTLLSLWSDRYRNPLIFNSQDHSIHDTNGFCRNNEIRWFSSKRKGEKKSSSGATTRHQPPTIASNNDDDDSTAAAAAGSSQHNTWIQFQRSIAVTGFETGQTTREQTLQGKKSRGGKIDRKRKEREAELEVLLRGGGGDGGGTQVRRAK